MKRNKSLLAKVVVVALVSVGVACGTIAGIEDYVIGDCKGGVGSVCGADVVQPDVFVSDDDSGPIPPIDSGVTCVGKQTPPSIRVGNEGNTFCIDTTEVTNEQYQAFLDAKVPLSSQPPQCVWNTTFDSFSIDAGATLPVVNIDWCDARAYCAWAGKYLCGSVANGKKQGPVSLDGTSDYTSHQWMIACSAGGRRRYPYGALPEPEKCNTAEYDAGMPLPVGSIATCVGGYDGLHDLVGNVWEWYDGPCRTDAGLEPVDPDGGGDGGPHADDCWIKGGSYGNRGPEYDCRFDGTGVRRDLQSAAVGFRCCSD